MEFPCQIVEVQNLQTTTILISHLFFPTANYSFLRTNVNNPPLNILNSPRLLSFSRKMKTGEKKMLNKHKKQ